MADQSTNLLPDGDFKAELTLAGGTGRTTVRSPADVHIENGVITAKIVWSSPYYDLMIVDGKEYKPLSNDGNSVFEVEIPALDSPLAVQAETVAMSTPHLIDYTITVSGAEILKNEETSSSGSSASESSLSSEGASSLENSSDSGSSSYTSEELSSMLESMLAKSGDGSVVTGVSATVVSPEKTDNSGVPALAVIGISAALGAAVAFVAVTVGKKKK